MPGPTFASVTDLPCQCGYLQRQANDPDSPIRFDARTNEFHFTYQELDAACPSTLNIYHCPFCGGAAPESKRDLLFAMIPRDEEERIATILQPIHSLDDAIRLLGAPDFDGFVTHREHEKDGCPPSIQHHRQIRYEHLSTVADLWIEEHPHGKAWWQLQGKYIGNK